MDWLYVLLIDIEWILFCCFVVFVGGFDFIVVSEVVVVGGDDFVEWYLVFD